MKGKFQERSNLQILKRNKLLAIIRVECRICFFTDRLRDLFSFKSARFQRSVHLLNTYNFFPQFLPATLYTFSESNHFMLAYTFDKGRKTPVPVTTTWEKATEVIRVDRWQNINKNTTGSEISSNINNCWKDIKSST